jgi:hypothetical protein
MTEFGKLVLVAIALAIPAAGFAAGAGAGAGAAPDTGILNPVPGGLTLVPGTVVIPGVGGSAVTGTVPLAGTIGSPGVRDFNPRVLGTTPNPDAVNNGGALYPPTFYPQTALPGFPQNALPGAVQSTLPQAFPIVPGGAGVGPAALPNLFPGGGPVTNCPAGGIYPNGTC